MTANSFLQLELRILRLPMALLAFALLAGCVAEAPADAASTTAPSPPAADTPVPIAALLGECRRLLDARVGYVPVRHDIGLNPLQEQCLDRLAHEGEGARAAVPLLLESIDRVDTESRYLLLATLGFLGDPAAVPALTAALRSRDDRDVVAALESLWRLRATGALADMRAVEATHWYPRMREFARRAAVALEAGDPVPAGEGGQFNGRDRLVNRHHSGQLGYPETRAPECAQWQVGDERVPQPVFAEPPPEVVALRGDTRADYAVPLDGGHVLGINLGENGGELLVRTAEGKHLRLSPENVAGLQALPDGDVLAALGLAHMGDLGGAVVRISARDGTARIVDSRRLPSAPNLGVSTRSGWLVLMANEEAVLVQPDLSMRLLDCAVLLRPLAQ